MKRNFAERRAFAGSPPAVVPGTYDDEVVVFLGGFFETTVGHDRTKKIFLIPPASHVEIWDSRLTERVSDGVMLPEIIIAAVRDKVVPRRNLSVEIFLVCVRKRTQAQIPVEQIETIKGKAEVFVRAFKQRRVFEAVAQAE